jgi:hypothetical protein
MLTSLPNHDHWDATPSRRALHQRVGVGNGHAGRTDPSRNAGAADAAAGGK